MGKLKGTQDQLRRGVSFGRRWISCYWKETFTHEGREVLVAEIPLNLLQRIECEDLTTDTLVDLMTSMTARRREMTVEDYEIFKGLWDEAVHYALGVRVDARRAWVYGEYSLVLAKRKEWMSAFKVAKQAFDLERALSGHARYWHRLLYMFANLLIGFGYGLKHPFLRSFSQTSHRASPARHARRTRRGRQRTRGHAP